MFRPIIAALLALAATTALPGVALAQDQAGLQGLFKPGAQIMGSDGSELGKVKSIGTDSFVLTTKSGAVTVPRNWVSLGSMGLFVDKMPSDIAAMAKSQAKK
jgi:hypothetical protein